MKSVDILSKSADQTMKLGERLARYLRKGDIICLEGDLGAGKTTFIKGVAKGLKIAPEKVNSPTFVLMNAYQGRLPLYHFDLYRLETTDEIGAIGYEEFLYDDAVCVIEWAERLSALTPKQHLRIDLTHKGENARGIKITAVGERYCQIINRLSGMK